MTKYYMLKDWKFEYFKLMILLFSLLTSVYIFFNTSNPAYKYMFVMPLFYGIAFYFILSRLLRIKYAIFFYVFNFIVLLRYVLAPLSVVVVDLYTGRSFTQPTTEAFHLSFFLVSYELIAVTFLAWFLMKKNNIFKSSPTLAIYNNKNRFVFITFIFFTLFLIILNPIAIQNFNFFIPRDFDVSNPITLSTMEMAASLAISVSKQIIFLVLINYFYKKYIVTKSNLWIFLTFISVILNISIYSGLNRSDLIMMTIASTYLIIRIYPRLKKLMIIIVSLFFAIIIPAITATRQISKQFEGDSIIDTFAKTAQLYLGSPYNVAIAIEAKEIFSEHTHVFNLMYDFMRPTFGLNFLVKDLPLNYSNEFFNARMYQDDRVIQIIPMIGEGYFYLGLFFAPVLTLLFFYLGYKLTEYQLKSQNIFIIYFLTITCARLGFLMGQNASIQMNDMSFTIFVPLILIWLNGKLSLKRSSNIMLNEDKNI